MPANAETPIGTCQPEDFGWSAVHLQHARSREDVSEQAKPRARRRKGQAIRCRQAQCPENGGERMTYSRPHSFVSARGRLQNSSQLKPSVTATSTANAT
jgi:hypothetical protein